MATVLVIEDDRDLYSLFDLILKMAGFEVNVVSNGTEALRRLSEEQLPDAITLDLHLPGVSGNEIYTMLEGMHEEHRVLVVSADVQEVAKYILRGAKAASKPIAMDDLIRHVKEIVASSLVLGAT